VDKKTRPYPAKHTKKITIHKIKLPQKYWCHTVVVSASLKPHKNQRLCLANKFCFDERFGVKVRYKIG